MRVYHNMCKRLPIVIILSALLIGLGENVLCAKSKAPLINEGSLIDAFNLKKNRKGYYRINKDYDLCGNVYIVPQGVTLVFTRKGLIFNGRICLQDSTTIIDGRFINDGAMTYTRRIVGGNTVDYSISVSVIDSKCVKLEGCRFESRSTVNNHCNYGLFVYGKDTGGSSNIEIDNCVFDGCCMGFFSNTKDCILSNTSIVSASQLFSIETLYDADQKHYIVPRNIVVDGCSFVCPDSDPALAPVWCSGYRDISFINCYFETDCTMLFLYCGDLNMGAENAQIKHCSFVIKGSSPLKKDVSCLTCMGRSYPFMKEEQSFGSAEIDSCIFSFVDIEDVKGQIASCRGISSRFFNQINVCNTVFDGFIEAICLTDSFKGNHIPTTKAKIINNQFTGHGILPVSTTIIDLKGQKLAEIDSLTIIGNSFYAPLLKWNISKELGNCSNCVLSGNTEF